MTPDDISRALEAQIDRLDGLVVEVRDAGEASARAETAFKVEFSKARLTIKATALDKLTVADIESEATIQCEELLLNHLVTENFLMSTREACRLAQTRCDALRTLSASFRNAAG